MTESADGIAVLVSGNGSNLQALIDARRAGRLVAELRLVLSNRPAAFGLERARRAGIPAEAVNHRDFGDRAAFEFRLAERIDAHSARMVLLAGFMRVLTPEFVARYRGRLVNIHPALLPAYRGLHTHERALADGVREHGCSVHFVTPELDAGPVIVQGAVPVRAEDDPASLATRVQTMEHRIYPLAANWLACRRVTLDGERVLWDGRPAPRPPRLSPDDDPVDWLYGPVHAGHQ